MTPETPTPHSPRTRVLIADDQKDVLEALKLVRRLKDRQAQ